MFKALGLSIPHLIMAKYPDTRTACGILLFVLFATSNLEAQRAPMKWEKVDDAYLGAMSFPSDSNAAAIILCDYGVVKFNRNGYLTFKRHTRIKILNESGYNQGTVSLAYYTGRNGEDISGVQGRTYNLSPSGKVEKHKMKKDAIFKEKVRDGVERIRFTLPALQPGSVIEYKYEVHSESPFNMPDWTFQHSEPTLWSEFRVDIPQFYEYGMVAQGITFFEVKEDSRFNTPSFDGRTFRWAMKDIPALREEPFMTTREDHVAKMRLQLSAYRQRGVRDDILGTWPTLATKLMDHPDVGRQIKTHKPIRKQVEAILDTLRVASETKKMIALYDYIRNTIKWDGIGGVFPNEKPTNVFKARTGDAPSIALTLMSMLKSAGLTTHPVLISTRSHGHVIDMYPLLSQFNYMLTYVEADGKSYLLDATDPYRPYTMLPVRALNGRGWLVDQSNNRWINIASNTPYHHTLSFNGTLAADGTLSGTLSSSDGGYSGLLKRHELIDNDSDVETFIKDDMLGSVGEMVQLENPMVEFQQEAEKPLVSQAHLTLPNAGMAAGDFIYLDHMLFDREDENPLKLEERTFPVDFAYPLAHIYVLNLTIPDGFAVQESPKSMQFSLPRQEGKFKRLVKVEGNQIQARIELRFKKAVFTPREYHALRTFYDRVVAAEAEQIVLKRIDTGTN